MIKIQRSLAGKLWKLQLSHNSEKIPYYIVTTDYDEAGYGGVVKAFMAAYENTFKESFIYESSILSVEFVGTVFANAVPTALVPGELLEPCAQ